MPVYYKIEPVRRLITSVAIGTLTDEDIADHQMRLTRDPDFEPGYRQLFDFTPSSEVRITYQAVTTSATNNRWKRESKRAFVVKSSVGESMLRLFRANLGQDDTTIGVFRSKQEAMDWLDQATASG